MISTIGAFIMGIAVLFFLWNIFVSLRCMARSPAIIPGTPGPWNGPPLRRPRKRISIYCRPSAAGVRFGIWRIPRIRIGNMDAEHTVEPRRLAATRTASP